jgi:phage terminase large subunit
MFVRTTAINKLLKLTKFVKGVQGGSSAGKTFGILPIEIDYAAKHPRTETSVVAETIPHLKRGAMKDFRKIMQETGRWVDERWNATDFKYTFANGSVIEFFSADNASKLRGARRDRLYMNEANNMTFHAYSELASRTKQSVFLDWNPVNEFWFHEHLLHDDDVDFIILNYLDNEAVPEQALKFILKAKEKAETNPYYENWYKVYGLGEIGSLQGAIFSTFEQVKQEEINDAELIALGLDWGFTNDPTALVAVYRKNGKVLLHELIYEAGLTNQDIGERMRALGVNKSHEIIADSAEPKSIEELRRMGFRMTAAVKGQDSVRQGIDILQRHDLAVTETSLNLIKELRNYKWATDKAGKTLNEPIDAYNHALDGVRYVALMKLKLANNGKYFILRS